MTIKVEQRHIDAGIRGSCGLCPVALACQEQITLKDTSIYVRIENNILQLKILLKDSTIKRYFLPQIVKTFVTRFDQSCKVEPFKFEL